MDASVLLDAYDRGAIGRRELLAALAGLAVSAGAAVAAEPAIGTVKQMNHVTVFVPNVQTSVAFYQRLFGMPILTPQDPGINLKTGSAFLGIYPAQDRQVGINHICFGLERFDADTIAAKLKKEGLEATIRPRGDTKELYFNDPDGIRVQLQDVRYIGGVGPLGDKPPK